MENITQSSVVRELVWARSCPDNISGCTVRLRAAVPPSYHVVMVGQSEALGCWNPERGVKMLCDELPYWYAPSTLLIEEWTEYKFVLLAQDGGVQWESGENRRWRAGDQDLGDFRSLPRFVPRMAGVAIPLFSLRSSGCEGIGDYTSMGDFAQWAAAASMRVVQTLPINDTTIEHSWRDSYPYNAISIYALHPIYIRVSEMDPKADVSQLLALDGEQAVDYDRVDSLKWAHFRDIYARKGSATFRTKGYKAFYDENKQWLLPYAVFSFLRDEYSTADYTQWPKPYNKYSKALAARVAKEHAKEIGLYLFLQFHADKQLRRSRERARKVGVIFKGDIPIGVSRHSVEVWLEPHLFNLNGQAGAPPDDFSVDGQNWGFPTYNWEAMSQDGYSWWRKRFRKMADYFDMYRIDHILGFFRIWEIPMPHKSGLLGHFSPALPFTREELSEWGLPMCDERYLAAEGDTDALFIRDSKERELFHPRISAHSTIRYKEVLNDYERDRYNQIYNHYFYHRHNDFWALKAMDKLPALIGATDMLCCAEDLGMIPECVGGVLERLQVMTLEIERMPKDPYQQFANPARYPERSVAASSTHDMSTIRGWWQEDRQLTQRFYNDRMGCSGEAPDLASGEICSWIVEQHLASPAMATILPLQDYLSMFEDIRREDIDAERINIPANPRHYWRYRMHLSAENLIENCELNRRLSSMIAHYKR